MYMIYLNVENIKFLDNRGTEDIYLVPNEKITRAFIGPKEVQVFPYSLNTGFSFSRKNVCFPHSNYSTTP